MFYFAGFSAFTIPNVAVVAVLPRRRILNSEIAAEKPFSIARDGEYRKGFDGDANISFSISGNLIISPRYTRRLGNDTSLYAIVFPERKRAKTNLKYTTHKISLGVNIKKK